MELRDYQSECINELLLLKGGEKVIVKAPTGSGKTILMAGLVQMVSSRVLIVVPSTELREQTLDKIKRVCGDSIDIGSVQGKLDDVNSRVVVATRQSLTHAKSNRMNRMSTYGEFEYILVDEAHQAVQQQIKLINNLTTENTKVVGFTATPYNDEMNNLYTKIQYEKHILDMIGKGFLIEPTAILVQSETDLSSVHVLAGEFKQNELEDTVNNDDRNNLIVDAYLKYAKDRPNCLIFATGIDHADAITEAFNRRGIETYSVDSSVDAKEREAIIRGFKTGRYKVLVNIGVLTTGFDMEDLSTIILCRPTKSRILYEQTIGRVLRTHPTKKDALVIDIVDVASRHDLMSMSDIFDVDIESGETPSQAKERVKRLKDKEKRKLEQARLEKELRLKREQELKIQQIELFNQDMRKAFAQSKLDWFRYDDMTYSLMVNSDTAYTIQKVDRTTFTVYKVVTEKNNKSINMMDELSSLKDIIEETEEVALTNGTSYCKKYTKWKSEKVTDKQLQYVKANFKDKVKTKWDCNKHFFNGTLWGLLKQLQGKQ